MYYFKTRNLIYNIDEASIDVKSALQSLFGQVTLFTFPGHSIVCAEGAMILGTLYVKPKFFRITFESGIELESMGISYADVWEELFKDLGLHYHIKERYAGADIYRDDRKVGCIEEIEGR